MNNLHAGTCLTLALVALGAQSHLGHSTLRDHVIAGENEPFLAESNSTDWGWLGVNPVFPGPSRADAQHIIETLSGIRAEAGSAYYRVSVVKGFSSDPEKAPGQIFQIYSNDRGEWCSRAAQNGSSLSTTYVQGRSVTQFPWISAPFMLDEGDAPEVPFRLSPELLDEEFLFGYSADMGIAQFVVEFSPAGRFTSGKVSVDLETGLVVHAVFQLADRSKNGFVVQSLLSFDAGPRRIEVPEDAALDSGIEKVHSPVALTPREQE